ncbi:MAG TPA: HAMP domain-containing protein, partial [Gallionella sp.]|nr:HAMP domain-containing protein [Gallionella sp.]
MSIGARLAAGFVVVVALFVANLLMVGVSFSSLLKDIQLIKEETLPYVLAVDEMDTARSEVQQWLTDVSATHNRDGYKDADEAAKRFLADVEKYKQMYQKENDAESLKKMQDIETSFNTFYSHGKTMAEAYITQGLEAGNAAMEGFDKDSKAISDELGKFREQQIAEAHQIVSNTVSAAELTMKEMAGGGLIAALLASVFSALISRSIIRPVSAMKSTMVEIGKTGDFTRRIAVDSKDEIGQTARSFNDLIGNLQNTLHELHDGIDR